MAIMANPYRGSEFGFPKEIPENLPSTGFEGWLLQEGYPVELLATPPGFPEGTPFFCAIYDDALLTSVGNPASPNYRDPYDPANGEAPVREEPQWIDPPEVNNVMIPFPDSGASRYEHTYTKPGTAVSWAGFSTADTSVYPLSFPTGGTLTFTATSEQEATLRFVFETNPYPDNDVIFSTDPITVSGPESEYTVSIPARPGEETYNSFLMFIDTADVPVTITTLTLS